MGGGGVGIRGNSKIFGDLYNLTPGSQRYNILSKTYTYLRKDFS